MSAPTPNLTPLQRINLLSAVADAVRRADADRPHGRGPDEPAVLAEVEKNLDTLVTIVRRSSADTIEPYLAQIQEQICNRCPNQLPSGHCPLRTCGECAFYRNANHVVRAIAGVLDGDEPTAAPPPSSSPAACYPKERAMFERILIAIDSSEPAEHAAKVGLDLAGKLGAHVALLTVVPPPPALVPTLAAVDADLNGAWAAAKHLLACCRQRVPQGVVNCEEMLAEGQAAEEILAAARRWRADALVVGTHARHGLSRLLLGSTAEAIVRRAPCSVLVVRPPPELSADDFRDVLEQGQLSAT
jgi:nucleotide-binding universal stress UspA family protein